MAFIDFSLDSRIRKKYVPLTTQQVSKDNEGDVFCCLTNPFLFFFFPPLLAVYASCKTSRRSQPVHSRRPPAATRRCFPKGCHPKGTLVVVCFGVDFIFNTVFFVVESHPRRPGPPD